MNRAFYRNWLRMRKHGVSFGIVTIAGVAVIAGTVTADDPPFAVGLMLVLLVLLMAWSRGVIAGLIIAGLAIALVAPYAGHALFNKPLDATMWHYLAVCYLTVAVVVGYNGTRFQRIERMNEELGVLNTIALSANNLLNVSQGQTRALAQIGNMLHPDMIQLYECSADGTGFHLKASRPMVPELTSRTPVVLPADSQLVRQVVRSRNVEIVCESRKNLHLLPATIGEEITNLIVVPLHSKSTVIALLLLGHKGERIFTPQEIQFMESVGEALTVSVENALLFEQVREQSYTDDLTGLGNRRMFHLRLELAIDQVLLSGDPISLAIFDIDHFKTINDTYGHQAGDDVLAQFAARALGQIRTTDLLCRIGGEEFALLTVNTPLPTMVMIVERVRRAMSDTPFLLADSTTTIPLTVSAGITTMAAPELTDDALIAAADRALYQAKANGRNRIEIAGMPAEEEVPA